MRGLFTGGIVITFLRIVLLAGLAWGAVGAKRVVVVVEGERDGVADAAVRRIVETAGGVGMEVAEGGEGGLDDVVVMLGKGVTGALKGAPADSYVVETVGKSPVKVAASGVDGRGMLYAAYRVADMIKAGVDLGAVKVEARPRVGERYVSFGATTHGRREYRPELYWKTLKELPRFGYNGVVIYPGGGTPIGRRVSPVVEGEDGSLSLEEGNTAKWREWLGKVDGYGMGIMMTVPPVVPGGYEARAIREYYGGGAEPVGYLKNLKVHFRKYLELLTQAYPEVDRYMFNSTEGATFGRNERFFGHPGQYGSEAYLRNNEAVMRAYFDVLTEHFGKDIGKVCFWTHSFGLTSEGIRRMREVLFAYPRVTIIEDDFWNNNLWPYDLPAMAYLPADLRARVSAGPNPFALFQIATDGEYFGGGSLPNAYPGSHVRTAEEAVGRGAKMVIQRMDLHDRTEYGTAFGTMEIVPLAASRRLWEPVQEVDDVWREWGERRFGRAAAGDVVAALKESRTVLLKGLSCNGMDLLCVGSEFNPRLWVRDEKGGRLTRFYLFGRPGRLLVEKKEGEVVRSEEYTAYQMKTRSVGMEVFERDQQEAMEAVRRGLARIEKARPHLAAGDYEMLKGVFVNGENVLTAMRLLGRAAHATNLVLDNFEGVADPEKGRREAIGELEAFLKEGKLSASMSGNIKEILVNYRGAEARRREKSSEGRR